MEDGGAFQGVGAPGMLYAPREHVVILRGALPRSIDARALAALTAPQSFMAAAA